MKPTVYLRLMCAALPAMLVLALHAADTPAKAGCENGIYAAPDSRLEAHIVGLIINDKQPVVGFEVVGNRPLVAFPHSLVAVDEKRAIEIPVADTIKGLSYQKGSRVLMQSDRGFLRLGDHGLEPDRSISSVVHGRIYGSGSPVFVEARARQGVVQFLARRNDGTAFPIAAIRGTLHAASWNELGLAAVVGDDLYLWQPNAKNVVHLLTDRGLTSAHDVVVVGNNRVVVTLKATVALVTPETITVVASPPSARCRFHNGILYVFQESNGLIWTFRGLEKLGTKQGDRTFALDLLKPAGNLSTKDGTRFQEAARILGCKDATAAGITSRSH